MSDLGRYVEGLPRMVWWLFGLGLLLRALFLLFHYHLGYQLQFDPGFYLALASNMQYGVYSLFHPMDVPDTTRMPGYPFLLYVFGGNVTLVLMVQVVASSLKVIMVYGLATVIGLRRPFALMAAGTMAFEPMDIMLSGSVLSEAMFTFFLLSGTFLLLRGGSWRQLIMASILFAAATWVRPIGLHLIVLSGVLVLVLVQRRTMQAVVFMAISLLLVGPWVIRNYLATDRLILSDSGVVAAAYFHVPKVLDQADDDAASGYKQQLQDSALYVDWNNRNETAGFMDHLGTEVRNTLFRYPLAWAWVQVSGSGKILLAPGRGHILQFFGADGRVGKLMLAISSVYSGLLLMAFLGWLIWVRRTPALLILVILLAALILFMGGISTADARFKDPAMPFLLIAVAWVAEQARNRWSVE